MHAGTFSDVDFSHLYVDQDRACWLAIMGNANPAEIKKLGRQISKCVSLIDCILISAASILL